MRQLSEGKPMRTRVSRGYQVVVPSQIRKRYGVEVGDELVWVVDDQGVRTDFRKKPGLENILSLGNSGKKESAVVLKKKIQRGGT